MLQEVVNQLTEQVKTLQERLAKDSHNSSLPPSSDRFTRQKKSRSLRKKSGKKAGGQLGHPGATLQMNEEPDDVIALPVTQCPHCQADLAPIAPQPWNDGRLWICHLYVCRSRNIKESGNSVPIVRDTRPPRFLSE